MYQWHMDVSPNGVASGLVKSCNGGEPIRLGSIMSICSNEIIGLCISCIFEAWLSYQSLIQIDQVVNPSFGSTPQTI